MSHVNLMTDTVIANLPPDGLRTVLRSIVTTNPEITSVLENHVKTYLQRRPDPSNEQNPEAYLQKSIALGRVMLGCGLWLQSLELVHELLSRTPQLLQVLGSDVVQRNLKSLDSDLIQTVTAIEKIQNSRQLLPEEIDVVKKVVESLVHYQTSLREAGLQSDLDRSLRALGSVLGDPAQEHSERTRGDSESDKSPLSHNSPIETFNINKETTLPRLFAGLWQLSSPSWGVASRSEVFQQFQKYARAGFTAYDMADHYGDAEVLFGEFKTQYSNPDRLFASTKLCIFKQVQITPEFIQQKVSERCRRLNSDTVDLLQFHWQFYDDQQYVEALRLLEQDTRISSLGLCNFDTQRMEEILSAGIQIVSDQVQFSLIDSRPTVKMGSICEAHNVKLLTYGTLCGGFIADKWLGKPEPELFSDGITPSQRKYFEMIRIWGGWSLFQELLQTLQTVGSRHSVSISNVATRWVLDFPYVGAVIVGARMGVSEHIEDNLQVYGWQLDQQDHEALDKILRRSRRGDIFEQLGDCGGEYRL